MFLSRSVRTLLLLAPLVGVALRAQEETVQFSVAARLVVLNVRVSDRGGSHVDNLGQEAFAIYEDGRPQQIALFTNEDAPATVGLIVDSSISMWPIRDLVIAGAVGFAQAGNPSDEVFGVAFNEDWWAVLPPSAPFTSDAEVLRQRLSEAIQPRGRTGLFDAIAAGLSYAERGSHARKVLVLISDGGDNASELSFDDIVRRTQSSNAVIYAVVIADPLDREARPEVLKRLARASGGEVFTPRTADQIKDVLKHIAHDIRHSYTLGYVPSRSDGQYHRLRVVASTARMRQLVVSTREGYRDATP